MNVFDFLGQKTLRAGFGVLALVALTACDPAPTGDTTCKSKFACEIIKLTAKDMRADIGEDFGGGVVLRNARALGQTLVVDLTLPLSSAAFKEEAGQSILKTFGQSFAGGFCEGPLSREFFKVGNTLRVRGFSKDSQLVTDQVIRSCGGR